jgi:hypothetical protein
MNQQSAVLGVAASVLASIAMVVAVAPQTPNGSETHAAMRTRAAAKMPKRICPNNLTERDVDMVERLIDAERRRQRIKPGQIVPAVSLGTIRVAFHVVYVDSAFFGTEGLLTQQQVQDQIDALNAGFDNVDFELASTSFTNNIDWFLHTPGSQEERNMKLALGADSSQFLNIYSTGLGGVGLLGYATFPWSQRSQPSQDGVVIAYDSIPGGLFPYDEGDTATHEVGHWLGLYHTFQGGCRRRNDGVADTPAEAEPFFGCTLMPPDTCPAPGLDPINNFMDYSDDACLDEFSAGQVSRMNQMISLFRPNILN